MNQSESGVLTIAESTMDRAIRHWPLIAGVAVLWFVIGIILLLSLAHNQGHLVYDVDDPYIHMAIARHFAESGVWGVTRYEFSSSSSSILWPLSWGLESS